MTKNSLKVQIRGVPTVVQWVKGPVLPLQRLGFNLWLGKWGTSMCCGCGQKKEKENTKVHHV